MRHRLPGLGELEALAAEILRGHAHLPLPSSYARASFVQLGGDSLRAMRLAAEAHRRLAVMLDVQSLLSTRALAQVLSDALAGSMEAGSTAGGSRRAPGQVAESLPRPAATAASPAQRGMWVREHVVGSAPYNLVFICFIDGDLRPGLLDKAIDATIARHEGLRTVFPDANGKIERHVLDGYHVPLDRHASHGDAPDFRDNARIAAARLGMTPFDLTATPPLRLMLLSCGARQHALVIAAHHIVLDAWAVGIVVKEIFARYDAAERGERPRLSAAPGFEEYLTWQARLRATGELDRQAGFWRRHLDGVPTVLDVPADRARPPFQIPYGARIPVDLRLTVSAEVRAQSGYLGVTPAAFLLAAFGLTLSRYSGAQTMLIGVPVAGRPVPELADLVAVTANLVPVRLDVDDDQTAGAYLQAVQQSLARSLDNADLPFEDLVAQTSAEGASDRHPLVQAAFGMHDGLIPRQLRTATLEISVEERHGGGSQFDLELFIRQREPSFAGDIEYASAVWKEPEAAAFRDDFTAAVGQLAASPAAVLEDIRCIAPHRRRLLEQVNDTARPYVPTAIDEQFRAQATRTPEALAVRDGQAQLTYAELAHAAAVQARRLADLGVSPGSIVLVAKKRSVAEVVGVLGALWAGAAYVGVEPGTPASRIDQMITTLSPAAVIGDRTASPHMRALPLAEEWHPSWLSRCEDGLDPGAPDPRRLAYVAFTSGSTGRPKGVCIPHRAVLRFVGGISRYAPISAGDRMLRFSPLSFDASTLELWGALLNGATLLVHPPGLPSPDDLGRFISGEGITVAWLTSALFRLVSEFALDHVAGMRHLLTGGDIVSPEHVRRVLGRHRRLAVINGYGPTENTTFTTVHRMTSAGAVEDSIPIGTPIANTRVYVLDHRQRLVPPGGTGELYAAGDGLADGYYGDHEQTARSFGEFSRDVTERLYRTGDLVRFDSNGRLRFLGRRDDQVKIRGLRIELGEIRAALAAHPQVSDVFVTTTGNSGADKRLLAACVPKDPAVNSADLAQFLAGQLPSYMVPTLWSVVGKLPLTANGKVDRAALLREARPLADDGTAGA